MKQLEIEYKTLLTPKEFERLSRKFSTVPLVNQTNYYFETEDFDLKKAKCSLRIRTTLEKAELTLKLPQPIGNIEHNLELTLDQAQAILDNQRLPLNSVTQLIVDQGIELERIKNIGQLTTNRRELALPIGLMALDENHYAGRKDYELELEVQDHVQGLKDFRRFLREHRIRFKYAKSKVARFSQTLTPKTGIS